MSTIEIKNLTKRYGEAEVLSNINMKLESGKIYGLVGRNGSGKTMLMKHILGFVKATQGTILINGKVVGENDDMQENIGAIIENPGFLPEYSGFTNLKLLAMIQGKIKDEQIKDAIRLVGLDPESSLDNDGVQEMWKLFLKQKEDGKLIVLASHSKEDIGTLCDEIFRFDKGKMVGHEIKRD